jgi:ABC-type transporter Mla MlaB component
MFRITTQTADDELVMKLEGCLAGPWVRELDTCWRDAMTAMDGRRVRIDLTAVCHVDAAGRELMTVMHRAGAQFVTRGCVMPEVVREISESADEDARTAKAGLPTEPIHANAGSRRT